MRAVVLLIPLALPACDGDRCAAHADCASDQVCFAEQCEPAFDRAWEFTIVQAEVGETHPDGLDWDVDGSPPDLWVEFGVDYGDVWATSVQPDDHAPIWDEAGEVYVPSDGDFLINLWEADEQTDEWVTGFYWEEPAAVLELLRSTGTDVQVTDGDVSLWLYAYPLF